MQYKFEPAPKSLELNEPCLFLYNKWVFYAYYEGELRPRLCVWHREYYPQPKVNERLITSKEDIYLCNNWFLNDANGINEYDQIVSGIITWLNIKPEFRIHEYLNILFNDDPTAKTDAL
jgi:hypothetical protein